MANKGILSKNYYIDPEEVSRFGAEVYNVMAEADQAMTEASEIIAEIASLTERVPNHIRCSELLEACASAQAEIKSVDFLSYGQKVDQGLQNLLDYNQYITEHFIKNMGMHTEKMRGLGEEFKRLSELITYSGEGVQSKGIVFSPVSNAEIENTDGTEGNASIPGQGDILKYFSSCDTKKLIAIKLLDTQIYNRLGIKDIDERKEIIQTILDKNPNVFDKLYFLNIKSGFDFQKVMLDTLSDVKGEYILINQRKRYKEQGLTMVSLCDPVVAYQGYPQEEGFDHIVHLVDKNYSYDNFYAGASNCYDVDVTARANISGRGWYSYMNRDLFDMEKYYRDTAGFDCTREGNQLTVDSGNQVFTFQLLDDKWWVDENGRYLITVGPKVLLADYGQDGDYSLNFNRFKDYFGCRIDVILVSDEDPDDILTLECVYGGDIKAHTKGNGVYMTGVSYDPNDDDAKADGSIVEFIGMPNLKDENNPDSDIDNGFMPGYHVEQIIVYDNDAEVTNYK